MHCQIWRYSYREFILSSGLKWLSSILFKSNLLFTNIWLIDVIKESAILFESYKSTPPLEDIMLPGQPTMCLAMISHLTASWPDLYMGRGKLWTQVFLATCNITYLVRGPCWDALNSSFGHPSAHCEIVHCLVAVSGLLKSLSEVIQKDKCFEIELTRLKTGQKYFRAICPKWQKSPRMPLWCQASVKSHCRSWCRVWAVFAIKTTL